MRLAHYSQVNLRVTKYRIDRDRLIVNGTEQMPETV